MNEQENQQEMILRVLRSGESLTVASALSRLGVYALSQRVGELKRKGHNIQSEMISSGRKRFKRYWLEV